MVPEKRTNQYNVINNSQRYKTSIIYLQQEQKRLEEVRVFLTSEITPALKAESNFVAMVLRTRNENLNISSCL